eukprot:jgi/Psemu1/48629/gm1.48629_g
MKLIATGVIAMRHRPIPELSKRNQFLSLMIGQILSRTPNKHILSPKPDEAIKHDNKNHDQPPDDSAEDNTTYQPDPDSDNESNAHNNKNDDAMTSSAESENSTGIEPNKELADEAPPWSSFGGRLKRNTNHQMDDQLEYQYFQ